MSKPKRAAVLTVGITLAILAVTHALGTGEPVSTDLSLCRYDRRAMMALDLQAFDQDVSGSGGGWRKVAAIPGCYLTAADLIRDYRRRHEMSSALLFWHEGQLRALSGQVQPAIKLFELSYQPGDPAWDAYVDATVAFLERDRRAFQKAREQLARVPPPWGIALREGGYVEMQDESGGVVLVQWPLNTDVVDGLLKCFDKPYAEAYVSPCRR